MQSPRGLIFRRRASNLISKVLGTAATVFGLSWLVWILIVTLLNGARALSPRIFTEMTPPPGSDGRVVAALRAIALAQRGAYQQAREMLASILMPRGGGPTVYACNIQPDDARCSVTRTAVQAKAYDAAIDVAGPFCGASVAEAYENLGQTFDAYVAMRRDHPLADPLSAAKLVAALGRPDVARDHLSWPMMRCRSIKKGEGPANEKERAECEQILAADHANQ